MNMPIDVIQIGDYRIPPVQCVRDLGVVFDHHMTMHKNITKTCASCYFHIRNISSIRDSLTDEATIQLVHAFVSSRIVHLPVPKINSPGGADTTSGEYTELRSVA